MQCALNIVANETAKDNVTINSSKSAVIIYNANKQREKQEWKLGENKIEEVDGTTLISIFRELRGKNDIESRIKKGRRTSYALLGAGLHGENGINPYTSYKLCTTFCRPRIIYGLETVQMLEGEKLELLKYERKLLEQLQGLPERCATLATYVLLGATPITTVIEKNTLTALYNIARHEDFIEHEIALRQLAIKDENSNSWFRDRPFNLQILCECEHWMNDKAIAPALHPIC